VHALSSARHSLHIHCVSAHCHCHCVRVHCVSVHCVCCACATLCVLQARSLRTRGLVHAPAHEWRPADDADGLRREEEGAVPLGKPSFSSIVACPAAQGVADDGSRERVFVGGWWGVHRSDGNAWVRLDITTPIITSISVAAAASVAAGRTADGAGRLIHVGVCTCTYSSASNPLPAPSSHPPVCLCHISLRSHPPWLYWACVRDSAILLTYPLHRSYERICTAEGLALRSRLNGAGGR
jgi:hypothetical protein